MNKFYLVLKKNLKLLTVFGIELNNKQTIISIPTPSLKHIHSTLHQPLGFQSSVFHVRENTDGKTETLLSVKSNKQNPELQDLGQILIDLKTHQDKLKPFRKKSFTDQATLEVSEFGRFITFYLFQGAKGQIENEFDRLLKTKKATIIIPTRKGFRIYSPKYPVKYAHGIFDSKFPIKIGVLALGYNKLNDKAKPTKTNENIPIKYLAFGAHGKRVKGEAS